MLASDGYELGAATLKCYWGVRGTGDGPLSPLEAATSSS